MNEKHHKKSRSFIIFLSLVVLSLIILTVDAKRHGLEKTPPVYVLSIFSYLQKGISGTFRQTRDFLWSVFGSKYLTVENRRLKQDICTLREQISQLKEYENENEELRKLLEFREKSKLREMLADSVGAEVIGRNPVNWYKTIVIDKGARDGFKKDMVVVTGDGLVGRIKQVGTIASRVVLVLDEDNCVSAIVQRTREHGIVQGQLTDTLSMKYLSGKTEVIRGDVIRSSGLGGIYPKGLLIGTITDVERSDYGLTREAHVLPAVDFSRLENVLVLRK